MGGGMMGGFGSGFGGLGLVGGLFGLLLNLVILIGIVWLVVWAVQKIGRSTGSGLQLGTHNEFNPGPTHSAREILDTRYARGELTREEYQTILGDLVS
jgi:putative membrane protein